MSTTIESNIKPWWRSKTIWFNLLVVGGAVVSEASTLLPVLKPILDQEVFINLTFWLGIVNIVLRSVTTKGVKLWA